MNGFYIFLQLGIRNVCNGYVDFTVGKLNQNQTTQLVVVTSHNFYEVLNRYDGVSPYMLASLFNESRTYSILPSK